MYARSSHDIASVSGVPDGVENVKDIAPVVAFLASEEASWITGQSWHITGGFC